MPSGAQYSSWHKTGRQLALSLSQVCNGRFVTPPTSHHGPAPFWVRGRRHSRGDPGPRRPAGRRHEAAGTAAFQKGDVQVAEASFRRCVELVPEQSTAHLQLGLAVLAADDGREEKALALFEKAEKGQRAIGADASMPVLYQVLTLQRLGRNDEAERRGRRHLDNHKVAHPELLARIRAALGGS